VLAGVEVTGGAGIGQAPKPYLPIDVFAVFDGEHVQPLGTDPAVRIRSGQTR
jgi:hypothetical protein